MRLSKGVKEVVRRILPRTKRVHLVRGGQLAGARIVTSWHDYPGAILGTTERPLLEWFSCNVSPGETWLDVGAHYGYTALALSRLVGAAGRVFAFEPVLATAGCVEQTRKKNDLTQLTVVPLALDGRLGIHVQDLPAVRGMADSTIAAASPKERILTVSFDRLWPSLCADEPRVHGIKIDVQGMEFEVLLGMKGVLANSTPKLVIEFHRGVDRGKVTELLENCGYATACRPVDKANADGFTDDASYVFERDVVRCAS